VKRSETRSNPPTEGSGGVGRRPEGENQAKRRLHLAPCQTTAQIP